MDLIQNEESAPPREVTSANAEVTPTPTPAPTSIPKNVPNWIILCDTETPVLLPINKYHVLIMSEKGTYAQVHVKPVAWRKTHFICADLFARLGDVGLIGTPAEEFYYEYEDLSKKITNLAPAGVKLHALNPVREVKYSDILVIRTRSIASQRRRMFYLSTTEASTSPAQTLLDNEETEEDDDDEDDADSVKEMSSESFQPSSRKGRKPGRPRKFENIDPGKLIEELSNRPIAPPWISLFGNNKPTGELKRGHVLVRSTIGRFAQVKMKPDDRRNNGEFSIANFITTMSDNDLIGTQCEDFHFKRHDPRYFVADMKNHARGAAFTALPSDQMFDYSANLWIKIKGRVEDSGEGEEKQAEVDQIQSRLVANEELAHTSTNDDSGARPINPSDDEMDIDDTENKKKKKKKKKNMSNGNSRKGKKLPVAATEILKRWVLTHLEFPCPSEADREKLVTETRLTPTQVRDWFYNNTRPNSKVLWALKQQINATSALLLPTVDTKQPASDQQQQQKQSAVSSPHDQNQDGNKKKRKRQSYKSVDSMDDDDSKEEDEEEEEDDVEFKPVPKRRKPNQQSESPSSKLEQALMQQIEISNNLSKQIAEIKDRLEKKDETTPQHLTNEPNSLTISSTVESQQNTPSESPVDLSPQEQHHPSPMALTTETTLALPSPFVPVSTKTSGEFTEDSPRQRRRFTKNEFKVYFTQMQQQRSVVIKRLEEMNEYLAIRLNQWETRKCQAPNCPYMAIGAEEHQCWFGCSNYYCSDCFNSTDAMKRHVDSCVSRALHPPGSQNQETLVPSRTTPQLKELKRHNFTHRQTPILRISREPAAIPKALASSSSSSTAAKATTSTTTSVVVTDVLNPFLKQAIDESAQRVCAAKDLVNLGNSNGFKVPTRPVSSKSMISPQKPVVIL